ncbi:MAG: putative assembly protein [Rickettsiales bacterium]|nr:putative assembly protein [Rickettsiales bacterium]
MKRLVLVLFALLILAVGGVFIAVKYVILSPEFLKKQLAFYSERYTGRVLNVEGDIGLSLFPFSIDVNDITFANAAGLEPQYMATVKTLSLRVDLIPLLAERKLVVTSVKLNTPDIYLVKDKHGKANWDIKIATEEKPEPPKEAGAEEQPMDIGIKEAVISNGTLHYNDEKAAEPIEVSDIKFAGSFVDSRVLVTLSGKTDALATPSSFLVDTSATLEGDTIKIENGKASLNDINAVFTLLIDRAEKVPSITGKIAFKNLDVTPLLPSVSEEKKEAAAAAAAAPADRAWSTKPIDFSGLRSVNLKTEITIDHFKARDWEAEDIEAQLALANGKLDLKLDQAKLLGGKTKGIVQLNAPGSGEPSLGTDLDVVSIVLDKVPGNTKAKGTVTTHMALRARGNTEQKIISSLNGKGDFVAKDGSIQGLDIFNMLQNISGAFATDERAVTVFSSVSATYNIANGILTNEDLKLENKKLSVLGEGIVDLPSQRIKYRITPNVSVKTEEATATQEAKMTNLRIPILVKGSLWSPSFAPDLQALVPDVESTVKDVLRDPKNAEKILKDQLKGNTGDWKQGGKALEKDLGNELQKQLLKGF